MQYIAKGRHVLLLNSFIHVSFKDKFDNPAVFRPPLFFRTQ